MFADSYDSFLSKRPNKVARKTLEKCNVLLLSREAEERLYKVFLKMNEFTRTAIEQSFLLKPFVFDIY